MFRAGEGLTVDEEQRYERAESGSRPSKASTKNISSLTSSAKQCRSARLPPAFKSKLYQRLALQTHLRVAAKGPVGDSESSHLLALCLQNSGF